MIRSSVTTLAALALIVLAAGSVQALDLTNRAAGAHDLKITEGDLRTVTRAVVIGAGQTLYGLCRRGCFIDLENGGQESFNSDETIYIEDGDLVTGE